MFSLDIIWKHAHPAEHVDEVGTAAAVRKARVDNIFRREDRPKPTMNQVRAIQTAKEQSINILAISGRFYVSNPNVVRELLARIIHEGLAAAQ